MSQFKVVLLRRMQFELDDLSSRLGTLIWRTSILQAVRNEKPRRKNSGRVELFTHSLRPHNGTRFHFSDVLIVLKLVLRAVPTLFTAVMIAIAIPAAIKPYSIAVAPD